MIQKRTSSNPEIFHELLIKAQTGDLDALNEILTSWRPFLRAKAYALLNQTVAKRVDPSDLVQDTMARVHLKLEQFQGNSSYQWECWLNQILLNQAKHTNRFHRARKRNVDRELCSDSLEKESPQVTPDKALAEIERSARIMFALESLPNPGRLVVTMRVFEQKKFDEISLVLNKSEGSVRVIWTRALRKLRIFVNQVR